MSILFHKVAPHTLPSPFFFFNDTATTEIYTLSLHDALPISLFKNPDEENLTEIEVTDPTHPLFGRHFPLISVSSPDRKSTRLNSSHLVISYAVFCLKKKRRRRSAPAWGAAARIWRAPAMCGA